MTSTNPHPLANPFNSSRISNISYGQSKPAIVNRDPSTLTVPEPMSYQEVLAKQRSLTVPNQDIPYGDQTVPMFGFIRDTTLFKLHDGTVIDVKTGRLVHLQKKNFNSNEYWDDPNKTIKRTGLGEWGKTETIESILARGINPDGTKNDLNLDPQSIKYWNKVREESKKLEQNLTDEQKQLLDDLNSGKIFPLSKLVDEDQALPN